MWNIPNILTLSANRSDSGVRRQYSILPVPWARLVCAMIFTVAAVTDWLDGYLARRWEPDLAAWRLP
jgi:phosphatidylglycerophosphate synthase